MLPDIDGFRICQKIRENFYFPVIMLTAKIDDGDKIMGLTIGADDYITKPFNILQSVICSGIILVCTVSLDMGLTWVLDRYVEHYYLIYRGLYVYMVGLILWVVCILYLTYKLLKKVVNYVYELQAATGKLFDKSVDYIELSPELSEIAININRLKQEAENNARLAQENEQRKNDLIMYLAHDLKTPLSSVIG